MVKKFDYKRIKLLNSCYGGKNEKFLQLLVKKFCTKEKNGHVRGGGVSK
jgi:hypothetical protein